MNLSLSNQPVRAYSKDVQLHSERLNPKRGNLTKFSPKTRKAIIKRDDGLCVRCKRPYHNIHHIYFASAGGPGEVGNGVCVCNDCHTFAHKSRKGREWFEMYRDKFLREKDAI